MIGSKNAGSLAWNFSSIPVRRVKLGDLSWSDAAAAVKAAGIAVGLLLRGQSS